MDFQNVIKKRRSIYNIGDKNVVPRDEIVALIKETAKNMPSAFNSQSPRLVILFGDEYQKFWSIVKESLRKIVPVEKFKPTDDKINAFAAGIGTILFFEDVETTEKLQTEMPTYAAKFAEWSEHNNAIVQYAIWCALAEKNLGASLQHYNPLIDDEVKKVFALPMSWRLIAQMPFGSIEAFAGEKEYMPIDERVKVLG